MDLKSQFFFLIERLAKEFDLAFEKQYDHVYEFYEGGTKLFRLIHWEGDKELSPRILVSFCIDLYNVEAIRWYVKIHEYHPDIYMSQSYFIDDYGNAFLGSDAEALRKIKHAQKVLAEWGGDKEEARIYGKNPLKGVVKSSNPSESKTVFYDKDQALKYFDILSKGNKGEGH